MVVEARETSSREERKSKVLRKRLSSALSWVTSELASGVFVALGVGIALSILWTYSFQTPALGVTQVLFIILLPFALAYASFLSARGRIDRMRFHLFMPPARVDEKTLPILQSVQESWIYERRRFRGALAKTGTHALIFGMTASITLSLAFLVYQQAVGSTPKGQWLFDWKAALPAEAGVWRLRALVAVACASAAAGGFLLSFARILIRLANQDFNARMYSWASRAAFLVLVATVISTTLLAREGQSGTVHMPYHAVLLGLTIAVFGSSVLELIANKAAGIFGISTENVRKASDLTHIDGLSPDDIERLAEEGVDSLHALAFVPTARLFFSTNHSLQRLVDWQDQALLHVYVGQTRAQALKDKLLIRGAIDLRGAVLELAKTTEASATRREALRQALGMDDGQLTTFIDTIQEDQVTRRLSVHWRATARISGTGSGVKLLAAGKDEPVQPR
jgi:hypothetical protein